MSILITRFLIARGGLVVYTSYEQGSGPFTEPDPWYIQYKALLNS